MLVKFLSFVASILGTARYKTVLLSCFAVVLSLTGVTAMAVFRDSGTADKSAASTVDKSGDDSKTQSTSPQLGSASKQSTKDAATSQNTADSQSQAASNQTDSTTDQSQAATQNGSEQDATIVVPAEAAITAGDVSDSQNIISAGTSDQSTVTWGASITNSNNDKNLVRIVNPTPGSAATFSFQVLADKSQVGKTVQITITARDASRSVTLSKQVITVTIQ